VNVEHKKTRARRAYLKLLWALFRCLDVGNDSLGDRFQLLLCHRREDTFPSSRFSIVGSQAHPPAALHIDELELRLNPSIPCH
ncbi:hypothetical protein, partial [Pseudomonas viridiflava]|uniref:hypothetical protein n=1 Tax=Pseudomonas viridiflava TaxID=33069 RepID=UPI00198146B3